MKLKFFLLGAMLLILALACSDELDLAPPSSGNPELDKFSIADARKYFEEHATDLSYLQLHPDTNQHAEKRTRSSVELIPVWEKAVRTGNKEVSLIEIPLTSATPQHAIVWYVYKKKRVLARNFVNHVRLMVAHLPDGSNDMFVVTLIPATVNAYSEETLNNFRYLGGGDFTGKVFCSTLDGHLIRASQYINGKFSNPLQIIRPQDLSTTQTDSLPEAYETLRLNTNFSIRTRSYSFDEETGGGEGSVCEIHGYDCKCLEEVIILACRTCGARADQGETCFCNLKCKKCNYFPCRCCRFCGADSCTCNTYSKCEHCNLPLCYGTCLDEDEDNIGGGDSGWPPPSEEGCPHDNCPVCHKKIRTISRSTGLPAICDLHEYCENDGKCVRVNIRISENKNTFTLGEMYTLVAQITPSDAQYTDLAFVIFFNDIKFYLQGNYLSSTSLQVMARTPGTFQIKAEVTVGQTTFESSAITVTHQFPDRKEIAKQSVFTNGVNDAWNKTLAAANSETVQEFGGVLYINTRADNTNGLYEWEAFEGVPASYEELEANITFSYEDKAFGPVTGGRFAVSHFHTHPPLWEYKGTKTIIRKLGPSDNDIKNIKNIIGVVKDFTHSTNMINSSMKKEEYENNPELYYYGEERKTN